MLLLDTPQFLHSAINASSCCNHCPFCIVLPRSKQCDQPAASNVLDWQATVCRTLYYLCCRCQAYGEYRAQDGCRSCTAADSPFLAVSRLARPLPAFQTQTRPLTETLCKSSGRTISSSCNSLTPTWIPCLQSRGGANRILCARPGTLSDSATKCSEWPAVPLCFVQQRVLIRPCQ